MTTGPIRISLGLGQDFMLVPSHEVQPWTRETATRRVRETLRDGFGAAAIRAAADRLGYLGDPHHDDALAAWLGGLIGEGRILVVGLSPPPRGLPVVFQPREVEDWSTAVPLSSLLRQVEDDATTWVSLEVVNQAGVPYAALDVTLVHGDGRRDRVVLDDAGRWTARGVAASGPTRVELPTRIEPTPAMLAGLTRDGFVREFGDLEVPAQAAGPVVLAALGRHHRIVVTPMAWRARLVMDDGAAVAGAELDVLPLANPAVRVTTAADGMIALPPHVHASQATVRVSAARVPRARSGVLGMVNSPNRAPFPFVASASFDAVASAAEPAVLVLQRPVVRRVDTDALRFDRGSCVLVPVAPKRSHLVPLAAAVAALGRRAGSRLLAVGHTSVDGGGEANEELAARRARCVAHVLDGDRDAWVSLVTEHGSPAEVQRLLLYLAQTHGWLTDPGRIDGVMDAGVDAAVASFQQQYNDIYDAALDVDGVCGEQTLGALFDCQTYELHAHLDTLRGSTAELRWREPATVSAAAEVLAHPAVPGSDTDDGQRRVDLLLLPEDLAWEATDGAVALLYDVARVDPEPVPVLAESLGDIVVHVVDHYGRPVVGAHYVLHTTAERREGTTDDAGILVERGLTGEVTHIDCGAHLHAADLAFHDRCIARRTELTPADPPAGGDDWFDEDDDDDRAHAG